MRGDSSRRSPSRRLRVVHVISDAGPHPYFRLIGTHADRERFDVRLATVGPDGALHRDAERMDLPAISLDAESRAAYPRAAFRLARYLRDERVDVLQSHLLEGSIVGLIAARLARTPLAILTGHHSHEIPCQDNRLLTAVDRLCAGRLCDQIIAPSRQMRDTFVAVHRVPADKVAVVHHGFELDQMTPSRADGFRLRDELALHGHVVIGSVGRVYWIKNQIELVRAFASVAQRHPDAALLLVGSGDYAALEELARSLGIEDRLRILPAREDVADVFAAMDLLVHAAIAESFAMVIIEAMAMARPVVSTPVGIAPEVVHDGETGVLAVDGRAGSLAAALERMFELRSRWPRMGQAARRCAECFPASAMVAAYEREYLDSLGRRQRKQPFVAAKHAAKVIRGWPGVNIPITSAMRGALRATGRDSPRLVKHLPRSGVVRLRLPNGEQLKLWSRGDDWISTQLFWRGMKGYEPATVPLLFALATRARLTVDVGAYVGYLTVLAALANPRGRVIALEPLPATHARLLRNVRLNRLSNVECVNAAAGAEAGRAELYHLKEGLSSAASLERAHLEGCDGVTSTAVEVVSLDELLAERSVYRVDLIKLDTETTELQVLAGAEGILRRDHPHIICEVLQPGTARAMTRLLEPLGYRFYDLRRHGPQERSAIVPSSASDADYGNYLFSTLDPDAVTALHAW